MALTLCASRLQAAFRVKGKHKSRIKSTDQLEALELLMLSLRVEWPLSIVLSPHALCAYQFVFRHLVNCKVRAPHLLQRIRLRCPCARTAHRHVAGDNFLPPPLHSVHSSCLYVASAAIPVPLAPCVRPRRLAPLVPHLTS